MEWTLPTALTMADGLDLAAVEALFDRPPTPLAVAEPNGMSRRDPKMLGPLTTGLGDDLAMICTKVSPTMSVEQSDAWIKVMVAALDDLPGRVSREAAQAVLRQPIRFLGDVDGKIREAADGIMARRARARHRLRELRAAMDARQRTAAEATDDDGGTISIDQVRALPLPLRQLGISLGAINEDDVKTIERESLAAQQVTA